MNIWDFKPKFRKSNSAPIVINNGLRRFNSKEEKEREKSVLVYIRIHVHRTGKDEGHLG